MTSGFDQIHIPAKPAKIFEDQGIVKQAVKTVPPQVRE